MAQREPNDMAIFSNKRSASLDEIVTEMDRRGRVIEELEAKIEALTAPPAPSPPSTDKGGRDNG